MFHTVVAHLGVAGWQDGSWWETTAATCVGTPAKLYPSYLQLQQAHSDELSLLGWPLAAGKG
jgi:hypothetical protein